MKIIQNSFTSVYDLFAAFEAASLFADELLEELPLIFLLTNVNGEIVRANACCEDYFELPKRDILGKRLPDLQRPKAKQEFHDFFETLKTEPEYHLEFTEGFHDQYYLWNSRLVQDKSSEQAFVVVLGDDVSLSMGLRASLSGAKLVQKSLLPNDLTVPFGVFRGAYEAADETGGDWYDYLYIESENRLVICMADVNGHGTPAAMITGCVAGMFRGALSYSLLHESQDDCTAFFVHRLNESLFQILSNSERMLTLAIIDLNLESGEGYYLNCGHPAAIKYSDNYCSQLKNRNAPIGVSLDQEFISTSLKLEENDSLFLYTDGLTENIDISGRKLGYRDLISVLGSQNENEFKFNKLKNIVKNRDCIAPHNDDVAFVSISSREV